MPTTTTRPTLRELTRESVRSQIADQAVDLFAEHGFDHVTVEQVAAAVGISARSFNRYFPSKEDAVLGDGARWGEIVRDELAARPVEEPAWESLRAAYASLLLGPNTHDDRRKRVMRVLGSTPSLRARNLEKHILWATMLTPLIEKKLTGPDTAIHAEVLVHASLTCFDIALTTWAKENEKRTPLALLETTFHTFEPSH
ncbi:TetR family transcriptional regulator [Microbacterium sp. GXF6406]